MNTALIPRLLILVLMMTTAWSGTVLFAADASKPGKIYASLEYYDDKSELSITDIKGFEEQALYFGYVLDPGHTIKTGKSTAEIRLQPNGTIIKLAPSSTLTIQSLQNLENMTSNDFSLLKGKIRMVASRLGDPSYQIKTPTAVAGVRGTDFGIEVIPGSKENLVVRDGTVLFTKNQGGSATVSGGQGLDALSTSFASVNLSLAELSIFFEELDFSVLSPLEVPGESEQSTAFLQDTSSGAATLHTDIDLSGKDRQATWQDYLDINLGTLLADRTSYGVILLKPAFTSPGFSVVMNLPVIYQGSILDPGTWYFPEGNNEWSFGTDQGSDGTAIALDIAKDLLLKFESISFGKPEDDFTFRFGELDRFSFGTGNIISGYKNNNGYPASRKQGALLGLDTGGSVVDFFASEVSSLDILALRYVQRPAPKVSEAGLGIFAIVDGSTAKRISASPTYTDYQTLKTMDPIIVNLGFDLAIPLLSSDSLTLESYADFGVVLPYAQNAATDPVHGSFRAGPYLETVFDLVNLSLRNYGWTLGVRSKDENIAWLLELQGAKGPYTHNPIDSSNEGTGVYRASALLPAMRTSADSSTYTTNHMALKAGIAMDLLRTSTMEISYRFPWSIWALAHEQFNPDEFSFRLASQKGRIPFGLGFDLEYQRKHFLALFGRFSPFQVMDEYAYLHASVELPVGKDLKLRTSISSSVRHNTDGTVYFNAQGKAEAYPVLTILTVLGE